MAESIALFLHQGQLSTDPLIQGDSTLSSLDRANTIEVLSLSQPLQLSFDRATLLPNGRRFYSPLSFTKRIDKATPLLRQALVTNQVLYAEFRWYRPSPSGDGSTQMFFKLIVELAHLSKAVLQLPDGLNPAAAALPPMESLELIYRKATWQYEDGGIVFIDELSET
jgi:type VI secretion system secreted protein Hcp